MHLGLTPAAAPLPRKPRDARPPVATPPPRSQPAASSTHARPRAWSGAAEHRPRGAGSRAPAPRGDLGRASPLSVLIRGIRLVLRARPLPLAWVLHLMPQARREGGGNCSPKPHAAPRHRPAPAPAYPAAPGHARYLRSARRRLPPRETCRLGGPAPAGPAPAALRALLRNPGAPRSSQAGPGRGSDSQSPPPPRRLRRRGPQGYRQRGRALPARLTAARERFRRPAPRRAAPVLPAGGGRSGCPAPGTVDSNLGRGRGTPAVCSVLSASETLVNSSRSSGHTRHGRVLKYTQR